MRIISNNHDYYDCIQKHSQDRTLIYHRKTAEIDLGGSHGSYYFGRFFIEKICIGFCGQIYRMIMISLVNGLEKLPKSLCYNEEQVHSYIKENGKKQDIENYTEKLKWWKSPHQKKIKEFFAADTTRVKKFFEEYKCPIFVLKEEFGRQKLLVNENLSQYQFYRIFDTFSAFQELERYLSNQAQPEKAMPVISDELKAQSKGFDKFSFRKEKTKKR